MGKVFGLLRRLLGRANSPMRDLVCEARKLGVNVGAGSRFTNGMPHFGSEPFLVSIGRDSVISGDVLFLTHDGGVWVTRNSVEDYSKITKFGRITVGDGCFIGARVTILPNVTIGNGSVVGACSVVTKSVPAGEVWAGNPAHKIMDVSTYAEKVSRIQDTAEQKELRGAVRQGRGYV